MAQTPQHVPYHEAARKTFKRPPCSTAGLAPWRLPDGSGFNVVKHVVVDDASRISDVIGQWRRSVNGEQVFIGLQPWQPGQPMPPILDVESDCNSGKSHGVFFKMIRELLLNDPTIPLLFFSVRITHAYDLFETLTQRYFVDDSGNPIGNLVCYKDGEDGVKERCKKATQLVISPQTAALDCLGNLERFTRGILVLDEAVSFALSLGVASNSGRATIKDPDLLINIFHRLAQIMPHVIVMDRDLTLTPIASKMQALLFPKRDVIHVQLERPAQRNSFCYTFGTKEHAKAGRGAPLALALFKLHALRCKETFEGTPDDGSDTGPTEWKRLWVVAGSKQYAEIVLLPILRQLGVKFRFYHAGSRDAKHPRGGAPSKQDLREPNQKWKHFHVIVATTTIEVAVNVTLPFLARWLFTCASESSSASELMQTVARVPRGTPEEQHAQLEDAAIYTLFAGNPPLVDAAPKPKHTDLQAIEKKAQDLTEAGWQSRQVELRATAARLRVYHESSAEPVPQLSMPYNELRASTMLYRQDHRGREHVRRFFEVADKGYFESQVYWMEADNNGDPPIGGEEIRNCPELLQLIEDEDPRASRRSDIEDLLGYRLRPEHYIE